MRRSRKARASITVRRSIVTRFYHVPKTLPSHGPGSLRRMSVTGDVWVREEIVRATATVGPCRSGNRRMERSRWGVYNNNVPGGRDELYGGVRPAGGSGSFTPSVSSAIWPHCAHVAAHRDGTVTRPGRYWPLVYRCLCVSVRVTEFSSCARGVWQSLRHLSAAVRCSARRVRFRRCRAIVFRRPLSFKFRRVTRQRSFPIVCNGAWLFAPGRCFRVAAARSRPSGLLYSGLYYIPRRERGWILDLYSRGGRVRRWLGRPGRPALSFDDMLTVHSRSCCFIRDSKVRMARRTRRISYSPYKIGWYRDGAYTWPTIIDYFIASKCARS